MISGYLLPLCYVLMTSVISFAAGGSDEDFLRMQAEAQHKLLTESTGQVIQQVAANGQRNLRPFTVKDKWEIQWDSKGTMLSITIFKADGKLFDTGPMQQGPGSGSSYQPNGGDYYLQVSGTGEWTVTVVQLR